MIFLGKIHSHTELTILKFRRERIFQCQCSQKYDTENGIRELATVARRATSLECAAKLKDGDAIGIGFQRNS